MSTFKTSAGESIVSNPSEMGPNVEMNTQETSGGTIVTNPVKSDLPGGFDGDWRETQWNAGQTFNPLSGQDSSIWGGTDGYSVGYWHQGSATATAGMSSYAVFQDPETSAYSFAMTVKGGKYNNQQLSTTTNFGSAYSFDHPIIMTTDIAVSGLKGTTGFIEGGINFTLQFDNGSSQYGLFLQIPLFDGRGAPVFYASLSNKSAMIYNLTGSASAYIPTNIASGNGTTYQATVDLNQALKYAIESISDVYSADKSALQDLQYWHLTGMYFGIESNGKGLSTDQEATLTVANPIITYDDSQTIDYNALSRSNRSISLEVETTSGAASKVAIPGMGVNIIVSDNGSKAIGTVINDYANSISQFAASGTLQNKVLSTGGNTGAGTTSSPAQGIVDEAGRYTLNGNYAFLYVGAMGDVSPQGRVEIDATANAAAFSQIISDSSAGIDIKLGDIAGAIAATSGNNLIDASRSRHDWRIATGDGDDTITGSWGTNTIDAGGGKNLINLGATNNYVLSSGQDTINGVQGAIDTVTLAGGQSVANLYTNAAVVDLSGNNVINVSDNSTVFGGSRSHVTVTGGDATIVGASNDTISASGNLTVTHGANLTISVGGALTFIAGTGNTTVSSGQGTVWGSQGLNLVLTSNSGTLFTANQPHALGDQNVDATRASGSMSFWTGAGNQTIRGGSGADQFYLGTSFAGVNPTHVAATVSGGTGAGNMFGMLSNHTAGDFYITDFRAANNKFFLYLFHPQNSAQAVQGLLRTATISGGNTSILVDGNARVTFVGVTDLKASDIIYS